MTYLETLKVNHLTKKGREMLGALVFLKCFKCQYKKRSNTSLNTVTKYEKMQDEISKMSTAYFREKRLNSFQPVLKEGLSIKLLDRIRELTKDRSSRKLSTKKLEIPDSPSKIYRIKVKKVKVNFRQITEDLSSSNFKRKSVTLKESNSVTSIAKKPSLTFKKPEIVETIGRKSKRTGLKRTIDGNFHLKNSKKQGRT